MMETNSLICRGFAEAAAKAGMDRVTVPELVAASVIREPISHRLFGRERLRVGFAEVVATLGPSGSMIISSLMIGID